MSRIPNSGTVDRGGGGLGSPIAFRAIATVPIEPDVVTFDQIEARSPEASDNVPYQALYRPTTSPNSDLGFLFWTNRNQVDKDFHGQHGM
jgi:hypothetical protein